jgi:hypothetical protein
MHLAKNRAASEDNAGASMADAPLKIATGAQPRVVMLDEAQACTCVAVASSNAQPVKVPRPCNCKFVYLVRIISSRCFEVVGS